MRKLLTIVLLLALILGLEAKETSAPSRQKILYREALKQQFFNQTFLLNHLYKYEDGGIPHYTHLSHEFYREFPRQQDWEDTALSAQWFARNLPGPFKPFAIYSKLFTNGPPTLVAGPPVGQRIAAPMPVAAGGGTTLFLDETGLDSAAGAWSIARKLDSSYAGSAIRVRRSSDSTEQDIGFSGNELDTSSLTTFCSGTDGFVVTIYDQSGNSRNLTQSTAANQPQIVSSGTILTGANSKPECRFDGSNDRVMTSAYGLTTPITCFATLRQITWVSGRYMLDGTTLNNMVFMQRTTSPRVAIFTPSTFIDNNDLAVGANGLATLIYDGANSLVQINAGTATTGTLPSGSPGGTVVGTTGGGGSPSNISFHELVIYASTKSSTDRGTARNNINAFYTLW